MFRFAGSTITMDGLATKINGTLNYRVGVKKWTLNYRVGEVFHKL